MVAPVAHDGAQDLLDPKDIAGYVNLEGIIPPGKVFLPQRPFKNLIWPTHKRHRDINFEYREDPLNMKSGMYLQDLPRSQNDTSIIQKLRSPYEVVHISRAVEIRIMWPGYKPYCHRLPHRGERVHGKWEFTRADFAVGIHTALMSFLEDKQEASDYVIESLKLDQINVEAFRLHHGGDPCKITPQHITVMGVYHTCRSNWQVKIHISDIALEWSEVENSSSLRQWCMGPGRSVRGQYASSKS